VFRVGQDRYGLIAGHTWKPLEEIIHAGALLEILEQRAHGHARAREHPGAADAFGGTLDGRTLAPVQHAVSLGPFNPDGKWNARGRLHNSFIAQPG
jgi:hypothetical protein